MSNVIDFYLESLYYKIINHPDAKDLDPLLIGEFKRAKRNLNNEVWPTIEKKFKEKINFVFAGDEEMCFTILSSYFKDEFLDKDEDFISQLCAFLVASEISPISYIPFTKRILKKNIYETCMRWTEEIALICAFDLYFEFFIITNSEEECDNAFLKFYAKEFQQNYIMLFDQNDDLPTIYQKLKRQMAKENSSLKLTYSMEDFNTLEIIKLVYLTNNEQEKESLLKELLTLEKEYNTISKLTRACLNLLKNKKSRITETFVLTRTKKGF